MEFGYTFAGFAVGVIVGLTGIVLGSYFAVRVPERILRPTLASMLILVGGKLIAF